MSQRLALFHFMPVEGYPPVQNLIHTFSCQAGLSIQCYTTKGTHPFETTISHCKIERFGHSATSNKWQKINLYLSYLLFNFWGLAKIFVFQPHSIIYYETLSAFPALAYKRLFPKTKLLIHYHEYTTSKEYASGSVIIRWLHKMEIRNYSLARNISHTNEQRLSFFCKDNRLTRNDRFIILPNYPPESWSLGADNVKPNTPPYRMVYVGYSLDNENMYADEIFNFIATNSHFTLDCFLFFVSDEIKSKAEQLSDRIVFRESIEYSNIPSILKNYHIGLILYKGHIPNYIYNAPNKLFEYTACGLDVWYPEVMVGTSEYNNTATFPKVIAIDFEKLEQFNWEKAINREGLINKSAEYYCEPIYNELLNCI